MSGDELERFGREVAALQDEALAERDDLRAVRSRLLRTPEPRCRRWVWAPALGLAAAALAALFVSSGAPEPPAPLAFTLPGGAAGTSGTYLRATEPERIAFSDGSALELAAGSDLRVAAVDEHGARLDLQRGRVRLAVVHRDAATSWAVHAGPYVVHVVGTRFAVDWDPDTGAFALRMEEGEVRLEGPEGVTSVRGGETVEATLAAEPTAHLDPASLELDVPEVASAAAVPAADSPRPRRAARLDWRRLAREGRHREALDAVAWERVLARGDAADLVLLGDAARFAGQSERATAAYQAVRTRFPTDGRAAQAAFFLGRLALARQQPRVAAAHFGAAAAEDPAGPFAALALGRRIEALHAAGEAGEARVAGEDYLRRWPEGAHAAIARRVTGQGGDEHRWVGEANAEER